MSGERKGISFAYLPEHRKNVPGRLIFKKHFPHPYTYCRFINRRNHRNMLTVIIPVLNEEKTIASVVRFCQQFPLVTEIIVVDDKSEDNTVKIAEEAGARVIIS